MIFAKIVLQINMWNVYKYTQEQCKDKKKQTAENGKIKNLKNNGQKIHTNIN